MGLSRIQDLTFEGSYYLGIVFCAVIYGQLHFSYINHYYALPPVMADNLNTTLIYLIGIYLGVYCLSIHDFMKNTKTTRLHRNFYISYSSVLLLLNTIYFIQEPYIGQVMWIKTRNSYPGGPLAYYYLSFNAPISVLGDITQTIASTLNSGLLESFLIP
jgi:hypothetical protein